MLFFSRPPLLILLPWLFYVSAEIQISETLEIDVSLVNKQDVSPHVSEKLVLVENVD